MFRKKTIWIVLLVLVLATAGGGYYYYNSIYLPAQEPTEPTIKTTKVRQGDLVISASGAGTLVPVSEIALGFRSSGTLAKVEVEVGDKVEAGDVLAQLDDTDALKAVTAAELQVAQAEAALTSQQDTTAAQRAVALAEIQVAQAEAGLAAAQLKLDELLNWTPDAAAIELAQASLEAAEADYNEVAARSELKDDQLTTARVNLEQAIASLADAEADYANAMDTSRDWEKNIDIEREATARALEKAKDNLEIAQANYNLAVIGVNDSDLLNAWTKVLSARAALQNAQAGVDAADIEAARIQVQQAELSLTQARLNLEAAQWAAGDSDTTQAEIALAQAQLNLEAANRALEQTTLTAPVAGTVVALNAQAGETVGTTPLLTLADLSWPMVEILLDETELDKIAVGYEVQVVFDALAEQTFIGHVVQVEPMLVTVDGVSAVQGLVSLDAESFAKPQTLPVGLNAAVEIIGGRVEGALLVPVEALRELAPGQYAVFVMEDGEPKLRMVEVGLMDYTSAEIVSGLEQGDVVSTGIVETE